MDDTVNCWLCLMPDGTEEWLPVSEIKAGVHPRAVVLRGHMKYRAEQFGPRQPSVFEVGPVERHRILDERYRAIWGKK